jgi:hypothetical protein
MALLFAGSSRGSSDGREGRLAIPTLENPITVEVSDSNRLLLLENERDYVIDMPPMPLTAEGGLTIVGGRNVVIIGGEIFNDTPIAPTEPSSNAYGLYLKEQTGTVHVERLWIHGRGVGDGLVLSQAMGATIQVQDCRFATLHPVTTNVHTDGIQSWAGPTRLSVRNLTIRTAGVGLQVQPRQFSPVPIDLWSFERVNVVQTTSDAFALWKGSGYGSWWQEVHKDFWVKNLGHYAWPSASHWDPDGPAEVSGQRVKRGIPPKGSFVQSRSVGLRYRVSR